MNPEDLAGSAINSLTRRFLLVMYLPCAVAVFSILLLVWSGAPGPLLDFHSAWNILVHLGPTQLVSLAVLVLVIALLVHPLQLAIVRSLEGHWPRPLRPVANLLRLGQAARLRMFLRLESLESLPDDPTDEQVRLAGLAGEQRRRRFPSGRPHPTALGNVLAAAEERAGAAYGWDAVVAWPRLYPLLPAQSRSIVDDRRNSLDFAATMSVTTALTAAAAIVLLAQSGWALALAAVPVAISRLSYRGAVNAALAYGEAIHMSFDLHRFEIFTAMHLPLPANRQEEKTAAETLCDFWRQGRPMDLTYDHNGADLPASPHRPIPSSNG
ncbi:hypothetical protein AB0B31_35465 [Catellatospora citrea]|uniref:hypothetical protein n=1 Tax=Catellatospora citrea TaxID=53366 RepID=UPI0033C04C56